MKELFDTPEKTLKSLKELILNDNSETWQIVDILIWFIEESIGKEDAKALTNEVFEHFQTLVRPEEYVFEKHSWLKESSDHRHPDVIVVELIIWMLNHPLNWISQSAEKGLRELIIFYPDLTIKALIKEAISRKSQISCITSSKILLESADFCSESIINYFANNPDVIDEIAQIHHFSVFKQFLDLSHKLNDSGFSMLKEKMEAILPDTIIGDTDIALEEDHLYLIRDQIDELNELGILNRKFCEDLLSKIENEFAPYQSTEVFKADGYLKRSYPEAENFKGRFIPVLHNALNQSIMPRVGKNNINEVSQILNR